MRLVVIGAGAVGGVVAALLHRAGRDVALVARGAQLDAIRAHGLRVETPTETFTVHPPLHDGWRAGDIAFIAVKTHDVAAAIRDVPVPIVCATNGLEAERIALRRTAEVYAACVYLPATYLVPGTVQAWASPTPGSIDLGRYPAGAGGEAIAIELRAAGFASTVRADIMVDKRGKLLGNLSNIVEALHGRAARYGPLTDQARAECIACFAAAGLIYREPVHLELAAQPIGGAVREGGSTWQSRQRGAPLETDYLNGEVVLLGRLHGVPTPVNAELQRLAREVQS